MNQQTALRRRGWVRVRRAGILGATFLLAMLGFTSTASAAEPAVWIGSPLAATWPTGSSLPSQHHTPYGGDWSADLQSVSVGAPVVLYAAPQNGTTPVNAVVEVVRPACASGVVADGGYRVTVGLFTGGIKIGTATYAHINPSVTVG